MTLDELHSSIRALLDRERVTNTQSYQNFANAKGRPYQSYERIEFPGLRWSVEKRIKEYGLDQYFNPNFTTLDVGANYGFFVTEFALHCKAAHGVEPVPELCEVGELTAKYLGVSDRTKFYPESFESFKASCEYDLVTTLAAFFTSDRKQRGTADAYFKKIHSILRPGGILFYESTSYQKLPHEEDYAHYQPALDAVGSIRELYRDVKVWETPSGPENLRTFAVAYK